MIGGRVALGTGVALVVASIGGLAATRADGRTAATDDVLGPGRVMVELGIEHSRFDESTVRVREGTEIVFVVDNGDPILHELIVGPPEVHRRHELGTEAEHAPRPGEVTVSPGSAATTTYRFDDVGTIEFACHLPGHLAYGMAGTVEVVPA